MAKISEGTLKQIRDDMFSKMQKLPIKYFDENDRNSVSGNSFKVARAIW